MKFLLLALLALPTPSFGAVKYCHTPAELSPMAQSCLQNAFFAEAGVICITDFTKKVNAVTGVMSKVVKGNVSTMKSAQDKNFDTTGKNYRVSEATLSSLIAEGSARQAEVGSYQDAMKFPDEIFEKNANVGQRLKTSGCYQNNLVMLRMVMMDFQEKIGDLKKAQAVASNLQGTTDNHLGNLDGGQGSTDAVKNQGPRDSFKGIQNYKGSDISGTQDPKKAK